ncbi:hypothetical protein ABDK56_07910 [Sphingomonas sp. ASV193]|uniref:hypothetical protein n=1 Tax=Sphingomonas sp. ASV193 TaxID=3144405 RepID=UPI0032E87D64
MAGDAPQIGQGDAGPGHQVERDREPELARHAKPMRRDQLAVARHRPGDAVLDRQHPRVDRAARHRLGDTRERVERDRLGIGPGFAAGEVAERPRRAGIADPHGASRSACHATWSAMKVETK